MYVTYFKINTRVSSLPLRQLILAILLWLHVLPHIQFFFFFFDLTSYSTLLQFIRSMEFCHV